MSVKTELKQISTRHNGILRPEDVVAFAKNPKTKLHKRFTWDDTKAAHEFRLWQARSIINVCVEQIGGNVKGSDQVWVSLPSDRMKDGGGYRALVSVLSKSEMRKELLSQALKEANEWQRKYRRLVELSKIFEAIRSVAK